MIHGLIILLYWLKIQISSLFQNNIGFLIQRRNERLLIRIWRMEIHPNNNNNNNNNEVILRTAILRNSQSKMVFSQAWKIELSKRQVSHWTIATYFKSKLVRLAYLKATSRMIRIKRFQYNFEIMLLKSFNSFISNHVLRGVLIYLSL